MRQKAHLALLLAVFMLFCPRAHADDKQIYICAKNMETGRMYHAAAYTTTGEQLNGVSRSSAYDPFGDYLVVLWDATHMSIITIKGPFSYPGPIPTNGTDQDGHPWEISLFASEICP